MDAIVALRMGIDVLIITSLGLLVALLLFLVIAQALTHGSNREW